MNKYIVILIVTIQLSGCASIFWQTLGGTSIGNLGAEVIKDKLDKEDDAKE